MDLRRSSIEILPSWSSSKTLKPDKNVKPQDETAVDSRSSLSCKSRRVWREGDEKGEFEVILLSTCDWLLLTPRMLRSSCKWFSSVSSAAIGRIKSSSRGSKRRKTRLIFELSCDSSVVRGRSNSSFAKREKWSPCSLSADVSLVVSMFFTTLSFSDSVRNRFPQKAGEIEVFRALEIGAAKWCKEHIPRKGNDLTDVRDSYY